MNVRIGKLAVGFDPITGLWHWSFWVLYDGGERGSRWTPLTYLRMMTFSAAHTFASATCEWTLERIGVAIRSDGLFLTHVSFQNGKVFFSLLSQLLLLFRLWQDGQQVTGSVVSLMRERS